MFLSENTCNPFCGYTYHTSASSASSNVLSCVYVVPGFSKKKRHRKKPLFLRMIERAQQIESEIEAQKV